MSMKETIETKLNEALSPTVLEVVDQSYLHAGHAGAREWGESHFRIKVVSSGFEGMNRVQMQREINKILKEELKEQIHALSMELSAS